MSSDIWLRQRRWLNGVPKINFPLCEVAHTSFRSVGLIYRQREREAMLRSTPRIEVNQRSREARLRLERVERLIIALMTRRAVLVPRAGRLAAKLRPVLSRSGLVLTALTDLAQ
jgi:hypothetical protein